MASEIRLRGAAAAAAAQHYPPRTPSSANNNSVGSSSSVVGEPRSASTTQRRRSRSRVLPGDDYYWTAGNNNNNNNTNTNNNNNNWTHKNNNKNYQNRNSQRNTNDRQQQQQQSSSSASRMETYATPRSASSSVSLGAPPMMMYPLHLQYQNDASGIASYYDDEHNNNNNNTSINHHDTLGGTTQAPQQPQQPSYDDLGKLRTGKLLRAAKTHLEDYHVAYRTPLHVADHQYRAYLLQGASSSSSRKQGTWWTRVCCLQTCIGFSVVAVLFLVFVGFLINAQPILMAGTLQTKLVQDSDGRMTKHYLVPAPGTVQPMARTAYRAAMAYFVCILACLAALHPGWIQAQMVRQRRRLYQDIPDHASTTSTTLPHIHNPNGDNGTTTTAHESVTPSWTLTVWNRCNYIIRQRLTDRGWYHRGHKLKKERKTG